MTGAAFDWNAAPVVSAHVGDEKVTGSCVVAVTDGKLYTVRRS